MQGKNSKYKLLSYIIPTYNAFEFLEETVDSIFRQALTIKFEVIICDDNSTDKTQELIKKLAAKYPEIKYFLNTQNLRAPNNRNFAIKNSSGDLIYMLDHDNILADNTIQKLVDGLENSDFEVASTQTQVFFKGSIDDPRKPWIHNFPNNIFTIKEYVARHDAPTTSGNYLYTRNAYDKTGGYPDFGGRENFGFGFRLVANGFNILIIPGTHYYHRLLNMGLWMTENKDKERNDRNMIRVFQEFIHLFDKKTQALINAENAYRHIDDYMDKGLLKLSAEGWMLAGGKHRYENRLRPRIRKYLNKLYTLLFNALPGKSKKNFYQNYHYYKDLYGNGDELNGFTSPFTLPVWQEYVEGMEKFFLSSLRPDFLTHRIIRETMCVIPKWDALQLEYLEERFKKPFLKELLREEKIGYPTISTIKYQSSPNTIHHLNHLARFEEKTGFPLKNAKRIIEWGGGYGNLARIYLKMNPDMTYSIIDLPIFIFLQAVYLSCIFDQEKINIILNSGQSIKEGCINLIPLNESLIADLDFSRPDIFISTWALSESNEYSQCYVGKLDYFKSANLLIAHQKSSATMPFAGNIAAKMANYRIICHEKIPYIKGDNKYLFAKRIA